MAIKNQNSKTVLQKGSAYWLPGDVKADAKVDVIKLASYKRAVGNFVNIVTGSNDIKVKYTTTGESFTNGKTVVLSARFTSIKDFDVAVGLSLHEGSHCLLSDFESLRSIKPFGYGSSNGIALETHLRLNQLTRFVWETYSKHIIDWQNDPTDVGYIDRKLSVYRHAVTSFINEQLTIFKTIINIIEDRRIDRYVMDVAPGYQSYYDALYNEYFNSRDINKVFQSKALKSVEWKSYMFCLTNIMNENLNVSVLPRLDDIVNEFDLKRIDRLKTTHDSIELAKTIYRMIADIIPLPEFSNDPRKSQPENENPAPSKSEDSEESGTESESSVEKSDESSDKSKESSEDSEESTSGSEDSEESAEDSEESDEDSEESDEDSEESDEDSEESDEDSSKEVAAETAADSKDASRLAKILAKQEDFTNGKIKKSSIKREISRLIDAASESDSDYVTINDLGDVNVKVLVAHGITQSIIDSNLFQSHIRSDSSGQKLEAVEAGVRLGAMLGKRLKTRDEDRSLKTSRLESGRIDRRLIAELGFNNERIFQTITHSTSAPASIHISIDASGSMSGKKWFKTITAAVAIAKAADSIQSMDCSISLRGNYTGYTPLMWVVYDSRKDKFQNFRKYAHYLDCNAATPEGLCFEAVAKEIIATSKGKDAYFINLSDGEPSFSVKHFQYTGYTAFNHTRKQIQKFRAVGITCLSYFIYDTYMSSRSELNFKTMYGASAVNVDVTNLVDLSKSINLMFERKIS